MKKNLLALGVAFLALSSCSKNDEPVAPLVIPTTYDATTYVANTTSEKVIRTNFNAVITYLAAGRNVGNKQSAADLKALFEKDSPSLASITNATFKAQIYTSFDKDEKASLDGKTPNPNNTPAQNGNGGIYGGRLFDENGVEFKESVEKLLFSWALFDRSITLIKSTPTQASLDKAICLWGADASFPNTSTASKTTTPDDFSAKYTAARTKGTGGLYTDMQKAFIKAQAAIKAGDKYNSDRDAAIKSIALTWEKGNIATAIFYLNSVYTSLSAATLDDNARGGALHSFNEATGFFRGLRGISNKTITDAQIDKILDILYVPAGGTPQLFKLISTSGDKERLKQALTEIKAVYGFTDQEMLDFQKNWVSTEGR